MLRTASYRGPRRARGDSEEDDQPAGERRTVAYRRSASSCAEIGDPLCSRVICAGRSCGFLGRVTGLSVFSELEGLPCPAGEGGSAITSLKIPASRADQLVTALDRDLRVQDTEFEECWTMVWLRRVSSLSSPLATSGLDGCRGTTSTRRSGRLGDLELADLRVAR